MERPRILCIHGIGGKDASMDSVPGWADNWRRGLKQHLGITDDDSIRFMKFDSHFDKQNAGIVEYAKFISKTFLDFLAKRGRNKMISIKDWMDDYPDMVVEYLQETELKRILWDELHAHISSHRPDIIYAHSLGSLLCYDFFSDDANRTGYENITLVTAGSQLCSRMIRAHIKSPIIQLPIKKWYNLNNDKDLVFASRNILAEYPNFRQVETFFDDDWPANHDGYKYLNHQKAVSQVWKTF
ncbi:hypothetical protein NAL32_17415 [Chryseobacterium sp. Ch-15]|uniref:Uncharacterized protein n=1 Tax=Chryseobacterium muglaense TaxID=2893752 RepID=A0A9Q3V0Q1_9FLAO|nr:hypothetical protein [Chryseobacterium muglaense]MBD3906449.1 hypothetical protein [Chryseobacterium muglaense]MCC9036839.1 hypothetical protein [Chryseobacterium muglaense]MCM2556165.1 hypothetical protein [Chryseobacterium muglaense]